MAVTPREAFEAVLRRNADMVWAFILTVVRDFKTAEQVFQDTFTTAWKRLGNYDSQTSFGSWIRSIAVRIMSESRRNLSTGKIVYFDDETMALLEVLFARISREQNDKWDAKVAAVEQCVNALPKPAQELVSLYYNKNYNCREISSRIGKDQETVKKRMQRSRKIILDCVNSKLTVD